MLSGPYQSDTLFFKYKRVENLLLTRIEMTIENASRDMVLQLMTDLNLVKTWYNRFKGGSILDILGENRSI